MAKNPSILFVSYAKSHVKVDLTERGKVLPEPVSTLTMTSSEQWHTLYMSASECVGIFACFRSKKTRKWLSFKSLADNKEN